MPSLVRDRCICLRKFDYSETSQILTLLSGEHGLLRVIAKGAKRTTKTGSSKFGGGVDVLEAGEAVFTDCPERELATLTEWTLLEGHLELRRNLRPMYLGLYAAELVAMLIEEHDPHPELFDRLDRVLVELSTPALEEAFVAFELDLLRETGYLPELALCSCGAGAGNGQAEAYFSPARGGVVCSSCEGATPDRIAVDTRLLRLVQNLFQAPRLPRLTRHQTDPINRILAEHVEHTLQRRLRLVPYILGKSPTVASARFRPLIESAGTGSMAR